MDEHDKVVTNGDKTLIVIENNNIMSDGTTFTVYVWAKDMQEVEDNLENLYREEFGDDDEFLEEFKNSSEIYAVYAYEI